MELDHLNILAQWIEMREEVRRNKEAGKPKPWTHDHILQSFRFCNVRREDDKVTKWFAANWRSGKYWAEHNFVPAIILGRTINWPETLEALGFPYIWDKSYYKGVLDLRMARREKVYTGAYMITAGPTGVTKNDWVLGNADTYFNKRPILNPYSLEESWETLQQYPCVGPFIAGQIVADLAYTSHLSDARDWHTWAALGPGSMRGLNRLWGRNLKFHITQEQGLEEMREVQSALKKITPMDIHIRDVQNCLCEFDKYERVMFGQGKPRSAYPGNR